MHTGPQYRITPEQSTKALEAAERLALEIGSETRSEILEGLEVVCTLLTPEFTQKGLRLPHANYTESQEREALKILNLILKQATDERIVAEDRTIRAGCDLYLVIDALMECEENGADEYTRNWGQDAIDKISKTIESVLIRKDEEERAKPCRHRTRRKNEQGGGYHHCRYH